MVDPDVFVETFIFFGRWRDNVLVQAIGSDAFEALLFILLEDGLRGCLILVCAVVGGGAVSWLRKMHC
jgi:hypothetical protein